jgi:hypothetical protein
VQAGRRRGSPAARRPRLLHGRPPALLLPAPPLFFFLPEQRLRQGTVPAGCASPPPAAKASTPGRRPWPPPLPPSSSAPPASPSPPLLLLLAVDREDTLHGAAAQYSGIRLEGGFKGRLPRVWEMDGRPADLGVRALATRQASRGHGSAWGSRGRAAVPCARASLYGGEERGCRDRR